MDPRLLDYYNSELAYMRELGAEFARQHPKVAGRLGMSGIEVADPYVERLLEGFAFLAGRIHLKMDAEFPRFSQRLLELVYPHYLRPTPAMGIARLTPSFTEGGVSGAFKMERHTLLRAPAAPGQVTGCEFRTAHEVMLLPLKLTDASIQGAATPLPTSSIHTSKAVRSSLHLRFSMSNTLEVHTLGVERISLFIGGPADRASQILELIGGRLLGALVSWQSDGRAQHRWLPPPAITCDGFAEDEALLPYDNRSFSGYRILHEYFACPDRFRFFSINGLGSILAAVSGAEFEVTLLFEQAATALEKLVTKEDFDLHCTPVVNLFPMRGDRIDVSLSNFEQHLVADRTRPLDFEVHTVSLIHGYTAKNVEQQAFRPLLETLGRQPGDREQGFFTLRREPRRLSETAKRSGSRSGYIGSEVFVQLVDQQDAPYSHELERIAPDMLCTNRDLPLLVSTGGAHDLEVVFSAPVGAISILGGLTPPVPAVAERDITWRLISHLHLNYHTLTDLSAADGAQAMRDLLGLYSPLGRRGIEGQANAVRSMRMSPMVCRMPQRGPIVFGRGVAIETSVDTSAFAGHSPWLFGAVLEQFMARHVSINSAIQFRLSTMQGGPFAAWPVRQGARPSA
ncbi:MAG: type VI secretion system baseplate subunit TssF [Burkholderiaceae bacterium]|jgi:type VI secretion system protein ImpG|nr:type VI secretion system baseplate subunit TssF [Burkholderiaceae bacterium]